MLNFKFSQSLEKNSMPETEFRNFACNWGNQQRWLDIKQNEDWRKKINRDNTRCNVIFTNDLENVPNIKDD